MQDISRSSLEAQYDHDYVDPDEGTTLPSDNTTTGCSDGPADF